MKLADKPINHPGRRPPACRHRYRQIVLSPTAPDADVRLISLNGTNRRRRIIVRVSHNITRALIWFFLQCCRSDPCRLVRQVNEINGLDEIVAPNRPLPACPAGESDSFALQSELRHSGDFHGGPRISFTCHARAGRGRQPFWNDLDDQAYRALPIPS